MIPNAADRLIQLLLLGASDATAGGPVMPGSHSVLEPVLFVVVWIGLVSVPFGMLLCLFRMLRGPHLADRVLAGDVLAMQVVSLVILLGIYMRTTVSFDAALVIAIIGFASTLAFAQYIGSRHHRRAGV